MNEPQLITGKFDSDKLEAVLPKREMNIVSLTIRAPLDMDEVDGYPVEEAYWSADILVPFSDVMQEVNLTGFEATYDDGWQYEIEYELKKFSGHDVVHIPESLDDEICQALIAEYRDGGE